MEYLQVFDENKKMLNEKIERSLKLTLPEKRYFMIILLFIENEKGEFLFQKTVEEKDGKIATTGGHVSFGDDGLITTIKEAKEEIGITFKPEDLTYIDTVIFYNCYLEIYYTNKLFKDEELLLQESEVESVKWYTVDEINKLIEEDKVRPGNIPSFKKVLEYKNKVK